MTLTTETESKLRIRPTTPEDGAAIWRLVREGGGLDLNSPYAYVLMCIHFRETCRVAVQGEKLVGFVVAYRPPERANTLFVWQVGVSPEARGRRVANRLLLELLSDCREVRYLEASVTPDNGPSQALFRGVARDLEADCRELTFMPASLFPEEHAPENLFRIGPFTPPADTTSRRQ